MDIAALPQKSSLHSRIRSTIEHRIRSGEWRPGYRIPFEHELMAEYGCSRMTVNKALHSLVEAGLIERRRRAGSFVRRPNIQSALLAIPDIPVEIVARGQEYRYELLHAHRRRASKADRQIMGVPAGAGVLVLRCRHFAGRRPFALEDRRIMVDEVPDIAEADFRTQAPGSWLLRHIAWHVAEHQIAALPADAEIAPLLDVAVGTACLVMDRQTWRAGAAITAVRLWFPGDLQKLVARFTPSGADTPAKPR
jgi:GntR family histidine utilization transcriptional repressor